MKKTFLALFFLSFLLLSLSGVVSANSESSNLNEWFMHGRTLNRISWDGVIYDKPFVDPSEHPVFPDIFVDVSMPDSVQQVVVSDGYLYAAVSGGVSRFNASNISMLVDSTPAIGGAWGPDSPIAVNDMYVYYSGGYNTLYQIDKFNLTNIISSVQINPEPGSISRTPCAPVVTEEYVFCNSGTGGAGTPYDIVYISRFNASLVEDTDAIARFQGWSNTGTIWANGFLAYYNGYVYGGVRGAGVTDSVFQIDVSTMDAVNSANIAIGAQAGLAVYNDSVYIPGMDSTLYKRGILNFGSSGLSVSLSSDSDRQISTPAFYNGYIFVGVYPRQLRPDVGALYKLNQDLEIVDVFSPSSVTGSGFRAPTVSNNVVYVTHSDGVSYELNAEDLTVIRQYPSVDGAFQFPGVAVTDKFVYGWDSATSLFQREILTSEGCTDPEAFNYDPNVDINDGSCIYDVNQPVVYNVFLSPLDAYSNTTFTCTWNYLDYQDRAENQTKVSWFVNDINVAIDNFSEGDDWPILPPGLFTKHDDIRCFVEGNNGFMKSVPVASNTVRIKNTPPSFEYATLSPIDPSKEDVLLCNAHNWEDIDGDNVQAYTRFFSESQGVIEDWYLGSILDCENHEHCFRNETIWCETLLFDGEVNSTSHVSNNVTLINTPPRALDVIISPFNRNPLSSENLNCTYTYFDLDGDPEVSASFKWFRGGVLTAHTDQILDSSETSEGETWRCSVIVYDGYDYSVERLSSLVLIDSVAPRINNLFAPDDIRRNTNRSVTWVWSHPGVSSEFNHYLCLTDNITSSGCEENMTLCNFSTTNSTTGCLVEFNETLSSPFYLQIYDDENRSSLVEPLHWDFVFEVPVSDLNISVTAFSNYNKFVCSPENVEPGLNYVAFYEFKDKHGNVLQVESGNNIFLSSKGPGSLLDTITCQARLRANRTYSDPFDTDYHLVLSNLGYSNNPVMNENMKIRLNVLNNESNVSNVVLSIRSPLRVLYANLPMTKNNVTGLWEYNFLPFMAGDWQVFNAKVEEENGQSYLFKGVENTHYFSVAAPPEGGGGGGGDIIEIIELPKSGNVTGYCGDGICQEWEDPFNCWQDCKINIDTLFTCIWDDELECNWEQSWFAAVLLLFLIIVIVVSIVYAEVRTKGKNKGKRRY